MIYLLNSPVLTNYGLWRLSGPLTPEQARTRLTEQSFQSAIGHEATAALLGELLHIDIPVQRLSVTLKPGDAALVFRLKQRQAEGVVLDRTQLAELPHELAWLELIEEHNN